MPNNCELCGAIRGEGPDPCLGVLPGVAHACCGHDKTHDAYVVFGGTPNQPYTEIDNPITLRGADALAFFDAVRRSEERVGWRVWLTRNSPHAA